MKNNTVTPIVEAVASENVHPMHKSHFLVSKAHLDMDNLTVFDAVSLTAVIVLASTAAAVISALYA